jgi:WD40 repeat protein
VSLGAGLFNISVSDTSHTKFKERKALQNIMQDLHGKELEAFYLDMSDSCVRQLQSLPHEDEVMSLAFSPDGDYLLAGGEDCEFVMWDVAGKVRKMVYKVGNPIKAVAYSPDSRYLAAGDEDGSVMLWDTKSSTSAFWDSESKAAPSDTTVDGVVMSLAMSSSPDFLAVGTSAKMVVLLSLPDMEEIAHLVHDGDVRSLSFSPDGRTLAGGGGTDEMHGLMTKKLDSHKMKTVLWKVSTIGDDCSQLGTVLSDDIVHAVAFSPSGELLATGGEGKVISLLLVQKSFEQAGTLICPAGVRSISWSPDSHFLASGGEDMQISVWDLLTEQVIFQLPKAKDWLCAVAFSPARTRELWIASCGFGQNAVDLCPVSLKLLSEQPLQADGAPKRRNSVGGNSVAKRSSVDDKS